MTIDVTFVLEDGTDGSGTVWRYFAESADDSDTDRTLGTGTITFNSSGNYVSGTGLSFTIDRDGTGAQSPQTITLDPSELNSMAQSSGSSSISLLNQNGFPSGTLNNYSIGSDGIITGSFTNGLTRTLGQIVLATFRNYEGLVDNGSNTYSIGPNSGDAITRMPMEMGAGSLTASALELSNVDLSREFVKLIVSSTGFSASSRVIQTSDEMLTELINLTR